MRPSGASRALQATLRLRHGGLANLTDRYSPLPTMAYDA